MKINNRYIIKNQFYSYIDLIVDDKGLENFDRRELSTRTFHIDIYGDNLKLEGIAIARRIIPMRERIKTAINHLQCISEVSLAISAPSQVGEIRRDAGAARGTVILVKAHTTRCVDKTVIHNSGSLLRGL